MSNAESGWTLYLHDDENDDGETECSVSAARVPPGSYRQGWNRKEEEYEDDDENLSMVSDASSGPPCYSEAEDWSCRVAGGGGGSEQSTGMNNKKKKKKKKNESRQKSRGGRHSDNYENTACSLQKNPNAPKDQTPVRTYALDFPQGNPISNIQGVSDYGKYQSPVAELKASSRKSSGQSRKFM